MAAQLSSPSGKPLSYTPDDVLWLSRAVEAEGEPREAVAQVLVNRWAWLHDSSPARYPSLTSLVRAYAQPINPRWFPDGDLHLAAVAREADADKRAELERKAVLRRDTLSTRVAFSPATLAAVKQALHGPVTIPAGALHYAAAWVERPDLPLLQRGVAGKSNSLWGEGHGRGVGALYAFQTPGPEVSAAAILRSAPPHGVFAFLLLFGGATWAVARSWSRKK